MQRQSIANGVLLTIFTVITIYIHVNFKLNQFINMPLEFEISLYLSVK